MHYVVADLLTVLGGSEINVANIKRILDSVGVESDNDKLGKVVSELTARTLKSLLQKLAIMPSGGGGGGAVPAAASSGAPATSGAPAKEEKKEEPEARMN